MRTRGTVIATVHPAYLLRLPDGADRDREWGRWIDDIRLAKIDG